MLGKLIRHEFRATGRIMLPLFAVVLFVSLLAHFSVRGLDELDSGMLLTTLMILTVVLFGAGVTAVLVVAFIQMVRRFRTNILGDEGYLTMTLPVSVHSLLWSKLIVSLVWFVCALLVIVLSSMIVALEVDVLHDLWRELGHVFRAMTQADLVERWTALFRSLEVVGVAVLSVFTACLSCYAALSVGYGFTSHKTVISVLAYIALISVMSWATDLLLNTFGPLELIIEHNTIVTPQAWHAAMGRIALVTALQGTVYYLITVWNLKHRLNLE